MNYNTKTMSTIDNERMIAEFMQLQKLNSVYYKHPNFAKNSIAIYPMQVHFTNLQYHNSWDWLMPVINKCYQEHISKDIANAVMTCDINEAYQVVVKFIKEFNH